MGVDFQCGDKSYSCSYSRWNAMRCAIIHVCYLYVRDNLEDTDPEYNDSVYRQDLLDMFQECLSGEKNAVNILINKCCNVDNLIDSLNYFSLAGLYALCNKSDCDGFYSPGNSLDICILLDKVRDNFIKLDSNDAEDMFENIYSKTYGIYYIFEESYKAHKNVWIF